MRKRPAQRIVHVNTAEIAADALYISADMGRARPDLTSLLCVTAAAHWNGVGFVSEVDRRLGKVTAVAQSGGLTLESGGRFATCRSLARP